MPGGKPNGKANGKANGASNRTGMRAPRERLSDRPTDKPARERLVPQNPKPELKSKVRMLRTEDVGYVRDPSNRKKLKTNLPTGPGLGRPLGSKNGIPRKFSEAILAGCTQHGEDGQGAGGLEGFIIFMIKNDLKAVATLISRLMPQKVQSSVDPQSALGQMLEAARSRLQYERSRMITVQSETVPK